MCSTDQSIYWEREWKNRIFVFLGGLYDEFDNVRSQILSPGNFMSVEQVYAQIEAEEQRRKIMIRKDTDVHPSDAKNKRSALLSRKVNLKPRFTRKCSHYKKLGHS